MGIAPLKLWSGSSSAGTNPYDWKRGNDSAAAEFVLIAHWPDGSRVDQSMTKTTGLCFLAALMMLVAPSVLPAAQEQSLADLAKKAEERRKTVETPSKVYTDADLDRFRPKSETQDVPASSAPNLTNAQNSASEIPRRLELEDVVSVATPAVVVLQTGNGTGSGFFAGPGIILTNEHVVSDAGYVTVKVQGRAEMQAMVVRRAPDLDLAVLRVTNPPADQTVLPLGRLADVRVGQEVVAIGSPAFSRELVLARTVTRGIVSALRRKGPVTYIQTDAAINPGNSGGPLIDKSGHVVGITSAKFVDAEALGLAIAIDHARALMEGQPQPTPPSANTATSLVLPEKSATDTMRERGIQQFEAAVKALAQLADEIDRLWQRYEYACRGQQTNAMAYGRDWFGLWTAPIVVNNETTPECRGELSDIVRLALQVRLGMQAAEEQARRAAVYPGTCRDIRRKYGMDWDGWDR